MPNLEEIIENLPTLDQSTDTPKDQIYLLLRIAGKLGLYDAGDVLNNNLIDQIKAELENSISPIP
jgi:hypothetical protein